MFYFTPATPFLLLCEYYTLVSDVWERLSGMGVYTTPWNTIPSHACNTDAVVMSCFCTRWPGGHPRSILHLTPLMNCCGTECKFYSVMIWDETYAASQVRKKAFMETETWTFLVAGFFSTIFSRVLDCECVGLRNFQIFKQKLMDANAKPLFQRNYLIHNLNMCLF